MTDRKRKRSESNPKDGRKLSATMPFADIGAVAEAKFGGVTAALRVNANIPAPLLCDTDVFDAASGDLSLGPRGGPVLVTDKLMQPAVADRHMGALHRR